MKLTDIFLTESQHTLLINTYNLYNIDREEPTDFPPIDTDSIPVNADNLQSALMFYLQDEFDFTPEEAKNKISKMEQGADGSLFSYEDNMDQEVLVQYSFK